MLRSRQVALVLSFDADVREFFQFFFRCHGWFVDFPDPTATAADKLATRSYDLIAADLVLPAGDGLQLVESLRQRGIAAPVLLLAQNEPPPMAVLRAARVKDTLIATDIFNPDSVSSACATLLAITSFRMRRTG